MRMSGWSSDVCSSDLDQAFDYLFVDEAGQVGLANVVAMGVAARNIVLVGDQMQLAQPIQGTHPRESGVSGLQHLLQNHATVPPERGVFLSETRRMHPDLRSEEHTSELQSLMRISYAVFCLKKKN